MGKRSLIIAGLVLVSVPLLFPGFRRRATDWLRQHDLIHDDAIIDPADLAGVELTHDVALNFFPSLRNPAGRMMYDPDAYVVLRPDRERWFDFEEHPAGRIRFKTNNRGFREDQDTPLSTDAYRILVLGDSQTEGVVANTESFPNVLQRLLDEADPARGHDVINAGIGTTGPHNYLGMLRKHRELDPDLVIVCFFAGNDFQEGMRLSDFFTKRRTKARDREYTSTLAAASERWSGRVQQGFNQAYLFRYLHADVDIALQVCVGLMGEMARLCAEQDAELIVVILPTKAEVDGSDETVQGILTSLALSPAEYALNTEMAARFASALREDGIRCVEPAPAMRATDVPLYWRADFHLNVAGNELLAGELLSECLARIEARDSAPGR